MHAVVREALEELADAAYQRRVWTASEGPEVGSLTEAIARLFDDSGLGDAMASGMDVYGVEAAGLLRKLDALLSELDDGRPPESILHDGRIEEVRRLSASLARALPPQPYDSEG